MENFSSESHCMDAIKEYGIPYMTRLEKGTTAITFVDLINNTVLKTV